MPFPTFRLPPTRARSEINSEGEESLAAPAVVDDALTNAEQAIVHRMEKLSPQDGRYLVLEAALAFKASWVMLGEHLTDVAETREWRQWGYKSFATYCADEIRVTSSTARKLVKSFRWLGEEAPEYIPRVQNGRITPTREVPDFNAIGVLADARKEVEKERVPEDAYLALKAAAFDGETTALKLRKELKEAIPEELREKPVTDKVRQLRKALTTSVKLIDMLRDWDGNDDLVLEAEALRDKITEHLPRGDEVQPEEEVQITGDADGIA
ncbi:MAG: hypothetical protein GY822_14540 [Deltaproteobacteria bacterium]|nr:hypothetical protein [Deltaproteobacteria bacterium]